ETGLTESGGGACFRERVARTPNAITPTVAPIAIGHRTLSRRRDGCVVAAGGAVSSMTSLLGGTTTGASVFAGGGSITDGRATCAGGLTPGVGGTGRSADGTGTGFR